MHETRRVRTRTLLSLCITSVEAPMREDELEFTLQLWLIFTVGFKVGGVNWGILIVPRYQERRGLHVAKVGWAALPSLSGSSMIEIVQ